MFIPVVIWAEGAALTAYDTYTVYQDEGAGAAAAAFGTGVALTVATGGAAKLFISGSRHAFQGYRNARRVGDAVEGVTNGGTTRVGRWMSKNELDDMSDSGKAIEGAGGANICSKPSKS